MKIAICQINTTVGDFDGNIDKVTQNLQKAKSLGCEIALFPELTLTGYPPRDLLDRFFLFPVRPKGGGSSRPSGQGDPGHCRNDHGEQGKGPSPFQFRRGRERWKGTSYLPQGSPSQLRRF